MKKILLITASLACMFFVCKAQDNLPDFKAENIGKNRMRITWKNPHGNNCIQINVQRSYDSLKNFRTIFSPISPELPQNGFVDAEGTSPVMYYRIFYVLEQGSYFFTASKRPAMGYDAAYLDSLTAMDQNIFVTIKEKDSAFAHLNFYEYKKFRDSIIKYTHDTLFAENNETILLKRFDPSSIWIPSQYVFTSRDGYIYIRLLNAKEKKYRLLIFENGGKKLFTLTHIADTELILDKTNFMRSGWYNFELYEDDKLKEKNKFYLPKEF